MADVKEKACPFRVRRVLRQTTLGGPGSEYVDEFLPCDGEDCAAYCQGACLRLLPPMMAYDPKELPAVCLDCGSWPSESCEKCQSRPGADNGGDGGCPF